MKKGNFDCMRITVPSIVLFIWIAHAWSASFFRQAWHLKLTRVENITVPKWSTTA